METSRIGGNLLVVGTISSSHQNYPANEIDDAAIKTPGVGGGIAREKLLHEHRAVVAQGSAAAATSFTQVLTVARGGGKVAEFVAGCVVANIGAATVTVDLKVNGATILAAPISITSALAARGNVAGVISTPALAADDVLEIVVTATVGGGTLGQGFFAALTTEEDAA